MLEPVRTFFVVIEEGSLNRAAARLRMSQSAVTRQMQKLENEIGGRLFERTSSGVQLTDAGHVLAISMRQVVAGYDDALATAGSLARGQRTHLRVGYLASAARAYLDPALNTLRQGHPGVKVTLLNLSPGEQIAALRRGEIDVALIGQEGCSAATDFYTRKLVTLPVIVILPADHRLARQRKIRLAELRGERFIRAPEADLPGRDRWVTQLCRQAGFRPKFGPAASSLSHSLTLIARDGAVMLGPGFLRDVPTAGGATVPLTDPDATWDFLVAWQRGRTAGPLRAFLDALIAAVAVFHGSQVMTGASTGPRALPTAKPRPG